MPPVLDIRDLAVRFDTREGVVYAVNGISYTLDAGEAMAIVGESGSGKSVSVLSVMGLLPQPPARVTGGQALLHGRDLLVLPDAARRQIRGREIAMIFQDPMTSLNPVLTIGRQVAEALRPRPKGRQAQAQAAALLARVGIPDAAARLGHYPHQFSGGQRQRIMIAMALACQPAVLIADEPTTALDVTVQAQIVALIQQLQQETGMAVLWITHDLALVAGLVQKVAVMYAGHLVEQAPVAALYHRPHHPYTRGLLQSIPRMDAPAGGRLPTIAGAPPDLRQRFAGCPFAPRCPFVVAQCEAEKPPLQPVGPDHRAACWRAETVAAAPEAGLPEGAP